MIEVLTLGDYTMKKMISVIAIIVGSGILIIGN